MKNYFHRKNQRKNSTNANNTSTRGFSNTLPSPRRRQHLNDVNDERLEGEDVGDGADALEGQADALYRTSAPMRSDSDGISAYKSNVSFVAFFR